MTKNNDIRAAAASAGLKLWQVAELLGMLDSVFSRKMRNELSPEEKKFILKVIGAYKEEGR